MGFVLYSLAVASASIAMLTYDCESTTPQYWIVMASVFVARLSGTLFD